jgi:hypothetical protein
MDQAFFVSCTVPSCNYNRGHLQFCTFQNVTKLICYFYCIVTLLSQLFFALRILIHDNVQDNMQTTLVLVHAQ